MCDLKQLFSVKPFCTFYTEKQFMNLSISAIWICILVIVLPTLRLQSCGQSKSKQVGRIPEEQVVY